MITKSRPLRLLCDANTDGLGVILEQKQPYGSICLIVHVRRATLRQRTELDSYSTRSEMRRVDYPTPSPLFIQRVLPSVREPRVPPTNKQKYVKASPASNAGWSSFQTITTASHTGEDEGTLTLTSFPDYHSPLPWKTSRTHLLCKTLTTWSLVILPQDWTEQLIQNYDTVIFQYHVSPAREARVLSEAICIFQISTYGLFAQRVRLGVCHFKLAKQLCDACIGEGYRS